MQKLKKSSVITALLSVIVFTAVFSGLAIATTLTCTVDSVKDGIVTLKCGDKAQLLHTGQKIKIRPVTKRRAIEGC